MSQPRKTCHGCSHLEHTKISGAMVAHCAQTGKVVPHKFESDPMRNTYWRVPMTCPLSDSEVLKSEEPVAAKDWETVTWETKQ